MAIRTSTFSGVTLTGEDVKVFKKQFLSSKAKANPAAQDALEKGRALRKEMSKKGYVVIHPTK